MLLGSGLVNRNVEYHDAVYALPAPFNDVSKELPRTKMRYRETTWGNAELTVVTEGLIGKQAVQPDRFNYVTGDLEKLIICNTTNANSNPGQLIIALNHYGREAQLTLAYGNKIISNNTSGSSPNGAPPFLMS
jgi:hypothetical protein